MPDGNEEEILFGSVKESEGVIYLQHKAVEFGKAGIGAGGPIVPLSERVHTLLRRVA